MTIDFDPGYGADPWAGLCRDYPGADVYPASDFRVEWGPLFHRGRLDGSARVLLIGQDPAQHEAITRSYVMVNTYLYSVYGQGAANAHISDQAITDYRQGWLNALVGANQLDAIVTLGTLADTAYHHWLPHAPSGTSSIPYRHITHPTAPNSGAAAGGDYNALVQAMLANWNLALQALHPKITHPDVATPLHLYGTAFQSGDDVEIPAADMPAGLPEWMRSLENWADRSGSNSDSKRATIVVTVPRDARPWDA